MGQLGVQAVPGTSRKTPHDTSESQAPVLHIEHTFYTQAHQLESEAVIAGQIQVTNSGGPLLENIYVYLHITGSAQEVFSDPYICYADGSPVPAGPSSSYPAIYFGNLAPGASSAVLTYYWTLKPGFTRLKSGNYEVTPILIPKFTVTYTVQEGFTTDSTTVLVSP